MRDVREREEECSTLLKCLDVRAGQTVCDMGCGNGFYTLELARLVGPRGQGAGGRHPAGNAADAGQQRAKARKSPTSKPIARRRSSIRSCRQAGVDLILLVDVYHEFSHPEHMLAAMRKSSEADGRLVLVEFRAEDPKCRSSRCTR